MSVPPYVGPTILRAAQEYGKSCRSDVYTWEKEREELLATKNNVFSVLNNLINTDTTNGFVEL